MLSEVLKKIVFEDFADFPEYRGLYRVALEILHQRGVVAVELSGYSGFCYPVVLNVLFDHAPRTRGVVLLVLGADVLHVLGVWG